MKKNNFLIMGFVCFLLSFSSCKKNAENEDQASLTTTSQTYYSAVMALSSSEARGLSFTQLSNDQKFEFVANRLDQAKIDLGLKDEQLKLFTEIRQFVKPELYDTKSKLNAEFLSFEGSWRERAFKAFSKTEMKYIFASFESFDEYTASAKLTSEAQSTNSISDCNCNNESDYCSGTSKCPKPNNSCSIVQFYCGSLFLYDCNSRCKPSAT